MMERKRIYLHLPVRSWSWVAMLLKMGRTIEIMYPDRQYRNFRRIPD